MSRSRISWLRFSSPCLVSAVLAAAGLSAQSVGGDAAGTVDFSDFLLFAGAFGGSEPRFDLDGDGQVVFPDFLLFAQAFEADNPTPDPPPASDSAYNVEVPVVMGHLPTCPLSSRR